MTIRRTTLLVLLALAACGKAADPGTTTSADASAVAMQKAVDDTDAATRDATAAPLASLPPRTTIVEQDAVTNGSAR